MCVAVKSMYILVHDIAVKHHIKSHLSNQGMLVAMLFKAPNMGKITSPIINPQLALTRHPFALQNINAHLGGFGIPAMHTVSQPTTVDVNVEK